MGNPFVHVELNSTDLNKARSFYQSLFDWKLEEMPMPGGPPYVMIEVGEGVGGGLMQHPMPGAPSVWIPYVDVRDVASPTAKARALGANIIRDVSEVPNMGSFSIVMDPTGAVFGIWQAKAMSRQ